MTLVMNVSELAITANNGYRSVKLNLGEISEFIEKSERCIAIKKLHNRMKMEYVGDSFVVYNFSVSVPNKDDPGFFTTVLENTTLDFSHSQYKIFKLIAPSGAGKSTILKAIINCWLCTDGTVHLPVATEHHIHFIPQQGFLPPGSLKKILTPKVPNSSESGGVVVDSSDSPDSMAVPLLSNYYEVFLTEISRLAILLLKRSGLMPISIKEEEFDKDDIAWSQRLSGGEKQKLQIIQAILAKPKLIIMDEATNALDSLNKEVMHAMIKEYIYSETNCIVIYTDHDQRENLRDAYLRIVDKKFVVEHVTDNALQDEVVMKLIGDVSAE